jgi:integrase
MGLGSLNTISLDRARELARQCREQRLNGIDPIEARREQRIAQRLDDAKNVTFASCAEEWLQRKKDEWLPSTIKNVRRYLSDYVNPLIGDLPISRIDVGLVHRVLKPIYDAGKYPTAVQVRIQVEGVLDWAKVKEYRIGDNPALWDGPLLTLLPDIRHVHTTKHHAALPFREMGKFMARLRASRYQKSPRNQKSADIRQMCSYLLEFGILTAIRVGEVAGARWDEMDTQKRIWTSPPESTKGRKGKKKAHITPLSDQAIAVLQAMREAQKRDRTEGEYVFVERRAWYPRAKWKPKAGKRFNRKAVGAFMNRAFPDLDATPHGFRSTFKDWAIENRYDEVVTETAMQHKIGDRTRNAYVRDANLVEPRRSMMQAWADYCDRTEPLDAKIIPLRQANNGESA